ncbi:hypothetical protein D3C75_932750 [compost metagenome]
MIWSCSSRWRLTSRTSAPISPTGSFTPLPECTQVMPSTRVFGPMAAAMVASTWSLLTLAGSSNRRNRCTGVPSRVVRKPMVWRAAECSCTVVRISCPGAIFSPP